MDVGGACVHQRMRLRHSRTARQHLVSRFACTIMACTLRFAFAGVLLLCLAVVPPQAASSPTLRGTVACLDCTPHYGHLSGVVVAVKCANGTGLRAAETDGRGRFEVAVPTATPVRGSGSGSGSRCAARILGGPEQLCAPQRYAAARVVVDAGRSRRPAGSYALASRLAVFTQCASSSTTGAAVAKARATPAATIAADKTALAMASLPGIDSPLDYNMGLPLGLLFPFFPIVGGGIP